VAANVADRDGELDLIAVDGHTLVIIEVRSTATDNLERTTASVDDRKQRKITGAALRFLKRKRILEKVNLRYDVVVMSWQATAREPIIRHIPNAFEPGDRFQFFS
jgi:putative endonuclease